MDNGKIAKYLKQLRKAHGYTQYDVSSMLGVVRQTYSNYESGTRTPSSETLYKLAGLYNISVEDLIHLTVDLDEEEYFDAPKPTQNSLNLEGYLAYVNSTENKKRLLGMCETEKELLYYFSLISEKDKREIIEFTKIKANMQ